MIESKLSQLAAKEEERETYVSWWLLQLDVYWLNEGANRDLSPRAAFVQT